MKFSSARITIINRDALKALASVLVGDCFYVTSIRIVEGKNGLFVSMPQRKSADGSYQDIAFPANKEIREELHAYLLQEYEKVTPQGREGK